MKINSIVLNNFGSYEGETTFDTNADSGKNIVLIGGKNGAGKTTLFTAMRVCLYGYMSMGYKNYNAFYTRAIVKLINNNAKRVKPTEASVAMKIALSNGQGLDLYQLTRSWRLDDTLSETFVVNKNGICLTSEEIADFEKYILSLIPPELFNLYFFDGEKIADFFMEVYVFRGEFIDALTTGVLSDYFDETGHCLKSGYMNMFNEESDTLAALAQDSNSNFVGLYRGCVLPYFKDANGNYISLDILFNGDKDNHKMIMKIDDDDVNVEDIWVDYPIGWSKSNKNVNLAIEPTYVKGYEYGTITRASSAKLIHDAVFDVLVQEKGVFTALTNHVDSEYHYIIDTFNTLIEPGCGKKIILAELAKAKDNALAILNYPAHSEFLNKWTGFSLEKLERGEYNGEWYLPSEVNGASYCAFYTPLVFGEGLVKTTVPSAAVVSNNFMEKWNSRQPYYIVAGPNYGRMEYEGLIGPDYNYGRSDLDVLEPYGVNCMVYVPRKGTYINSNQTAKQRPVSALSKVHVRELVIYLQNEIEAMLENYQWELNTQTLRDTIKTKADTILEKIKLNGGVYDYINVCDGTNNTPEVIDNEMVILDTSIEPARGAGKMVQRLTIHKTGGISSLTK